MHNTFRRSPCISRRQDDAAEFVGGSGTRGDVTYYSAVIQGKTFRFRIERTGRIYRVHCIQKPVCDDPRRSVDGHKINLLNNGLVWISDAAAPTSLGKARELARVWANCLLAYFFDGTPFQFPRDPDM